MNKLQHIQWILDSYSAFEYAEIRLEQERNNFSLCTMNTSTGEVKETKPEYYEYMKQTWHYKDSPPLEECIENSRNSKLMEYAKMLKMWTGFIENGKLFVLNKKEKFVSFIYEIEKDGIGLSAKPISVIAKTHYNPKKVDCIEDVFNAKYLSSEIEKELYDISKDEKALINECNVLCGLAKNV